MYYNHPTDLSGVNIEAHSLLVNGKASPVVTFQNMKKIYLGEKLAQDQQALYTGYIMNSDFLIKFTNRINFLRRTVYKM